MSREVERNPLLEESSGGVRYASIAPAAPHVVVVVTQEPNGVATPPSTLVRASSYLSDVGARVGTSIHTSAVNSRINLVRSVSGKIMPRQTVFCGICLENVDKAETYSLTGGDYADKTAGSAEVALEGCGHEYCVDCLRGYIRSQITDFNCSPACPYQGEPLVSSSSLGSPDPFPEDIDAPREDPVPPAVTVTPVRRSAPPSLPQPSPGVGAVVCGARASEADVRFLLRSEPELLAKFEKIRVMASNKDYRECPACAHLQLPRRDIFNRVRPAMTCEQCEASFCFEVRTEVDPRHTSLTTPFVYVALSACSMLS